MPQAATMENSPGAIGVLVVIVLVLTAMYWLALPLFERNARIRRAERRERQAASRRLHTTRR